MRGSFAFLVAAAMLSGLGTTGAGASEAPAEETIVQHFVDPGALFCMRPNPRRKTCQAIDTFEPIRDGIYGNTSVMAVGNDITLEIYTPVWVVGDALCGLLREQDLMAGTIRVGGRPVARNVANAALNQAARQIGPLMDREVCTRFEPSGGDFIAKFTIDGESWAGEDRLVKIIGPADGYRVAL